MNNKVVSQVEAIQTKLALGFYADNLTDIAFEIDRLSKLSGQSTACFVLRTIALSAVQLWEYEPVPFTYTEDLKAILNPDFQGVLNAIKEGKTDQLLSVLDQLVETFERLHI